MKLSIDLTDNRRLRVFEELSRGSSPRASFFLLVAVSTLIASFGLVMNSTAVVIGAMLVAPLMTPILGLALALVRGDSSLLGTASRSEFLGVLVSLAAGALLGLALPSTFEATPEMLARVKPNLLDLLVAVFAGLAGAYALVEERLSPVLPGVAISTAIVPPLANSGMCLALGAFEGAYGSFLLFFTNFLSILLVSALVFYLAGMDEELRLRSGMTIARRFGVAVVGLAVVGVLLGSELIRMFEDRRLRVELTQALREEMGNRRISALNRLKYNQEDDTLRVLADVDAPTVVRPSTVQAIQSRLEEIAARPVEFFVRTTITHDTSATGSVHENVIETLDGFFVPGAQGERLNALQVAEQTIREYLEDKLGIHLEKLNITRSGAALFLVAELSGVRHLSAEEISELQGLIEAEFEGPPMTVAVRQEVTVLRDSAGLFRTEFTSPRILTPEQQTAVDGVARFARGWFSENGYSLDGWSVTLLEEKYHLLFEVTGPTLFTRDEHEAMKRDLHDAIDLPIELYVRSVPEAVVGPMGHTTLEEVLKDYRKRNRAAYPDETTQIIRSLY